jgi:glycosyltransferase involved in cell wall biosynthesis
MPTVSIITIAYNHGKYIGKCIESVLAQTFRDFEQIIVDDGSTDTTAEMVERYRLKDSRIRLIRHEHIGSDRMSELYNMALAASKGRLIAVLDGDDYWPPLKLEKQIPAFTDENVVLAWGKAITVDEKGLHLATSPFNSRRYQHLTRVAAIRDLLLGSYMLSVTVMCRKSALELIGGFKQPHNLHCVDYPTWLALAALGCFKFLDSVLGYWVKHEGSLSSKFYKSTLWCNCSIDALEAMPQELKKQIGLTRPELIRLLQERIDSSMDLDFKRVYSGSELTYLFERHLATSTIHGVSPQVSLEMRRLNVPHSTARRLVRRAGRKLLFDRDWKDAMRSLRIALVCLSLRVQR